MWLEKGAVVGVIKLTSINVRKMLMNGRTVHERVAF